MATIHVWHGATGAADGTSWTDAYTTLGAAWTAWTSGDVVYMHSGHAESSATELLYNADVMSDADPFICYSVDKDSSDAYTPGTSAQVKVTGANVDIDFNDASAFYGVWFEMVDGDFDLVSNGARYFEDCTFKWTAIVSSREVTLGTTGRWEFVNCTFDNATAASQSIKFAGSLSTLILDGCTLSGKWLTSGFSTVGQSLQGTTSNVFRGCDFSGITNATQVSTTVPTNAVVVGCSLMSGGVVFPTVASSADFRTVGRSYATAVDGASTAKNYIAEHHFGAGTVIQDTAIYRDSGWTDEDGSTQLSHKMVPTSTMKGAHTPIFGPDLRAYVDATGSKTFTVYCVHDFTTAPTKDEAWIEVLYLGTSNSVLWSIDVGRDILSSTAWTVGTEAWTGASGKTKMELSASVTINKTGTYAVRAYLGKYEAAKALWYCPLVNVA